MLRKAGDCEDSSILFVTLCYFAGIPANRVFVAVGTIDDYGHAFPIVKMDDGKWYVFESTLKAPQEPIALIGSRYHPSWGFLNWKYQGRAKQGTEINEQSLGHFTGDNITKVKKFKLSEKENKEKLKIIKQIWKKRKK